VFASGSVTVEVEHAPRNCGVSSPEFWRQVSTKLNKTLGLGSPHGWPGTPGSSLDATIKLRVLQNMPNKLTQPGGRPLIRTTPHRSTPSFDHHLGTPESSEVNLLMPSHRLPQSMRGRGWPQCHHSRFPPGPWTTFSKTTFDQLLQEVPRRAV